MITGATGFAGGALVDCYVSLGWKVIGTCSPASELLRAEPRKAQYTPVDLRLADDVCSLVQQAKPALICHLAAQSSVSTSWSDPMATLTDNSVMQFNVLEAVARFAPECRVLVVGSSDEYGNVEPGENPLSEHQPLRPASPYALSKAVQDLMGLQYAETGRADVVRVRPFLQLGPRRSSHFASGSFARQIAEMQVGLRPRVLTVGDIDLVRDFTDVRDVARASSLAAERGKTGEVYNIASGEGHTLREVINIMLEAAGLEATIREDPQLVRQGEAPVIIGDAGSLKELTGWEPKISFRQSVVDTLGFWQERVASGTLKETDTI